MAIFADWAAIFFLILDCFYSFTLARIIYQQCENFKGPFSIATVSMFAYHSYFINWIIYTIVRTLGGEYNWYLPLQPLGRIILVPILMKPFGVASSTYTTQSSKQ